MLHVRTKNMLTVFTIAAFIALSVVTVRSCSTIKVKDKVINSLKKTVVEKDKTINNYKEENSAQKSRIRIQKKMLDKSEEKNELLSHRNKSLNRRLSEERKKSRILRSENAEVRNALDDEKNKRKSAESQLAAVNIENGRLRDKSVAAGEIQLHLATAEANIKSIRYLLAPKLTVFVSGLNHPDAKAVLDKVLPFTPKASNDQINFVWGEAGRHLRSIGRKLNIPDYESLYFYIVNERKNPSVISAGEVKKLLNSVIQSGDFDKIAKTVYNCNAKSVNRIQTVIRQVYKLS